jgi:hypothetical protein
MSNEDALWLLLVSLVGGTFVTIYMVWMIFEKTDMIVTGLSEGVPVSARYRMFVLLMVPLPIYVAAGILDLQLGLLLLEVARLVDSDRVRALCQLGAWYAFFGTAMSLALSPAFIVHLIRVARRRE